MHLISFKNIKAKNYFQPSSLRSLLGHIQTLKYSPDPAIFRNKNLPSKENKQIHYNPIKKHECMMLHNAPYLLNI